jgi:hypothetical protein
MQALVALVVSLSSHGPLAEPEPEGLWLSSQVSSGVVDQDVALALSAGAGMELGWLAVHVTAPLTLRLVDLPPATSPALPSCCSWMRCEEWLEAGELSPDALVRLVEDARLFRPGDLFHARAGRLFSTFGHGQLLSRYTNAADWDRRRTGLFLEANLPWGQTQAQALAGSLLSPQDLFAARIATRPFHDDDAAGVFDRLLGRLRFGVEAAGDAAAPSGPVTDAFGDIVPGAPTHPLGGLALDVDWPLFEDTGFQLEPWLGGSAVGGLSGPGGRGVGFGASAGLDVGVDVVVFALHGGARLILDGPGHRSAVFSTLYDVDRRRYALSTGGFSNSGVADLKAPGGIGGAASLELVVLRAFAVGARLHVDPVPEASQLELFADLDAGPVRLGARALQRALREPNDTVAFGDRTFVVTEAAWAIWPPFSLFARWLHGPRFEDAPPGGYRPGDPVADDDVLVGVSFDLVLEPSS